ncbi:hypothetical protein MKL09_16500 [Methylobacterium sp. J-048]|uniref:hypothetical protein n=1 Tax=Methylobacterium sp. J-048 TaxID=2836635 RepID=UPI001FB867A0|nr:hypothetical protein [Methylobacterium sp. J-048]MCJ2058152.1 hypothetical protein [Methylobacterium sp. J-048]
MSEASPLPKDQSLHQPTGSFSNGRQPVSVGVEGRLKATVQDGAIAAAVAGSEIIPSVLGACRGEAELAGR